MSNPTNIDEFRSDNMDIETHGLDCQIETEIGFVDNKYKVIAIFMVCVCGLKKRNVHKEFKRQGFTYLGDSIDLHISGKQCTYDTKKVSPFKQKFLRRCFCRHESYSYSR
ncbi:Hypothetical predicted protein [Mytilus galloprovincialis]|uniref:Uncharacterized protein n=1 Tax=Mytilus galloprovincialis TaxID=29158 RepID=A0A8B6BEU0_MYTGA|nr:Hypothetical predicted protein [Mytilus galloprovincialis]